MEIFYIKKFGTQDPKIGYNIRAGGGGRRPPDRGPMSEETKEKIRDKILGTKRTEEEIEKCVIGMGYSFDGVKLIQL